MVTLHIGSRTNIYAVTDHSGNEYPYRNCDQHFNCYTVTYPGDTDEHAATDPSADRLPLHSPGLERGNRTLA